jgi:hypothetical protein
MLNKIIPLTIGTTSVGAVEAVAQVEIPTSLETESTIKMVLQLIITIASLVGLFKRKRPLTTN